MSEPLPPDQVDEDAKRFVWDDQEIEVEPEDEQ